MSNIKQVIKYIYSLYPEAPEERGRIFEHYCKWFLENDPSYSMKLKKVWLWKDWPDNWGRDKGIDLIAETHSGEIWAIQAKFYDEIYYVTKEDMDRFLSESSRKIISYRLLISTTSLMGSNALEVINGQEKQVGVCTLNDLEEINLEWPLSIDSLNNKTVKKSKNPEPHQIDAIKNILDGFEKSNLGQVHMACGTGKTLVGLWVNQELKCQKTLVLVPSISLVSQLYNSWAENSNFKFDSIFICSDDTVSSNDEDEQIVSQKSEFGFPVTTSAQELINQLSYGDRPKIVFATYHSSPVIKEACKLDSNLIFDLSIADEAHRCSGPAKSDFATIIDKPAIRTKRKLFMTATPKIFSENVKQKTKELDYEIASMDDVTKFGPVFHKLSFSQAIQQDLLSDYQVLISVMDDITYREYAEKGRFVVVDDHETDARTLASQILVAKTIKKLNLKKVITFHNRTNAAKDFIKTFKKAANMLSVEDKPEISFTDSIFGDMQQSARRNIIKSFKEATNENAGILANVKCLSEGVDLPELDGIAFIDPKSSVIDIVQAVGRVIRKPRDKKIKKIGTIIIPVFVDTNSDGVMDLEESCFKVVWQVVNALRAHDDALAEELDNIRLELGKRTYKNPPKLSKIIFDVPVQIGAEFSDLLNLKIIYGSKKIWRSFEDAKIFVKNLKLKSEAEWRKYISGQMSYLPQLPNDIPRVPWVIYAQLGWKGSGDFLGTNSIAPRFKKYRSYDEAREFAIGLNLKRKEDWSLYAKGQILNLPCLPKDIPACPDKTYKRAEYGSKWKGYGDFLGTGRVAGRFKKYRSYEDAREFVKNLKLKTTEDWRKYISGQFSYLPILPDDIPRKPDQVYDEWVDWPSFLSSGYISKFNCKREFWPFEVARKFVHNLNLKKSAEWMNYCAGKIPYLPPKPLEIPSNPRKKYRNSGWAGYADWFGPN